MNRYTRREILGTAALSALGYAPITLSQENEWIDVELLQEIHRQQVISTVEALSESERTALEREGVQGSLDALWHEMEESDREHLFTSYDYDNLRGLISRIFRSEEDEIASAFSAEFLDNLGEVAKTVGALILGSVEDAVRYVRNFMGDVDWGTLLHVAAHDMRGAIDGARLGYRVHRNLGIPLPHAISVGALAGGISGSIIGYRGTACG